MGAITRLTTHHSPLRLPPIFLPFSHMRSSVAQLPRTTRSSRRRPRRGGGGGGKIWRIPLTWGVAPGYGVDGRWPKKIGTFPSLGAGLPTPSLGAGLPTPSLGAGLPTPPKPPTEGLQWKTEDRKMGGRGHYWLGWLRDVARSVTIPRASRGHWVGWGG